MDEQQFDRWTRMLAAVAPRRVALRTLVGSTFAAGLAHLGQDHASAKKKRKKLKRNAFGCVDVGGKCRGKNSACCSGICQGNKPKKGQKDKSRCVAHDTGTRESDEGGCRPQDDSFGPGDTFCTTTTGEESGKCWRTTGNAGFCGYGIACVPCSRDADCIDTCGEGAACVVALGACLEHPERETVCYGTALCDGP